MTREASGPHLVPGLRRAAEIVRRRRASLGDGLPSGVSVHPAAAAMCGELLIFLEAEVERDGQPSTSVLMGKEPTK